MTDKDKTHPTNGWTPERRAKQAETIRRNRPWEKSTGPTTEDGKARSALNAFRHGMRTPIDRDLSPLFNPERTN